MGITSPQHDMMKMKKPRLDNGDYVPYENGHHSSGTFTTVATNRHIFVMTPKYRLF
jgi:hypothetical protein